MSNETKWTPGPWVIGHKGIHEGKNPRSNQIVNKPSVRSSNSLDYYLNANLIAAAPDLYDALYDLVVSVELIGEHVAMPEEVKAAHEALSKARGEQ